MRTRVNIALTVADLAAAAALATALVIALTGGGSLEVRTLRLALHDPLRPLVLGIGLALLAVFARSLNRSSHERPAAIVEQSARLAFCTLCLAIVGLWVALRVSACGGLDSYGYVSAAHLFASGHLAVEQPLASILPFPDAIVATTPLGWIPNIDRTAIVPEFPPGLPFLMALFLGLLGERGPFWVSPVMGVIAMLAVYGVGRQVADRDHARLAAVLVGAHPGFITQAVQPMSDIAATAWLVTATYFLVRKPPAPLAAGLCGIFALLTRPPLVAPAIVLAWCLTGESRHAARRRYLLAIAGGIVCLALLQWALYGNPFVNGHGSPGGLFRADRVAGNVANYGYWFTLVHTPLFYVAVALGLWAGGLARLAWVALAIFAVEAAPYLAYFQFNDWETLRFLLPGLPLVLLTAAAGCIAVIRRSIPASLNGAAVVAVAWLIAVGSVMFIHDKAAFSLWRSEQRYAALGSWLALNTELSTVVLADLHSGSARLYGARATLRWTAIPPDRLGATIAALARHGHAASLVTDDGPEEAGFRRRFRSDLAHIGIYPTARIMGVTVWSLEPREEAPGPRKAG